MAVIVGLWAVVRGRWWTPERQPTVLLAPATFVLLILVPALVYADILASPDQLFRGPDMATYLAEQPRALAAMSSDPMGWIGAGSSVADSRVDAIPWIVLGLAALGLWRWDGPDAPGSRWWWVALTGMALVLSVGPVLHLDGSPVLSTTPYRLLMQIPPLGLMRLPHRWMLVATLGFAVMAARGARTLPRLGALLIFLETLWFVAPEVVSVDVTPPEVVSRVTGPVLDLPTRTLGQDARGQYLLWQRTHRQPTPYALLMQGWSHTIAAEPLVIAVSSLDTRDRIWEQAAEARQFRQETFAEAVAQWREAPSAVLISESRDRLRRLGFTQVILHRDLLHEVDVEDIEALVVGALGDGEVVGDALLWELSDE